MKLQETCHKCGTLMTSMPGERRGGFLYAFNCPKCGSVNIHVIAGPRYFHFELLIYANGHLNEHETRSAVVEAHTALDVFVRRWAQDALQSMNTPPLVAAHILKGARTDRLIRMVKSLYPDKGFAAPPGAIFDLRNDVIHKGKVPTGEEAERAITQVREWITDMMNKTEPVFTITPDVT